MSIASDYKFFILDLDNTIYDERIYLFHAYSRISILLGKYGYSNSSDIYSFLTSTFETDGRSRLFNKLFDQFDIDPSRMNEVLSLLRTIKLKNELLIIPEISLFFSEVKSLGKEFVVFTNGNIIQQKNKVSQIRWGDYIPSNVYYANEIEPKPSTKGLQYIFAKIDYEPKDSVLIGDSLEDKECANSFGITFIHVNDILRNYQLTP